MSDAQPDTGAMALALRCEAASRADRELDADIHEAAGFHVDRTCPITWHDDEETPPYSRSIDAARTLVPDGMRTATVSEMEHDNKWQWRLGYKYGTTRWGKGGIDGYAATPALALCAAALKARAHGQGGDGR